MNDKPTENSQPPQDELEALRTRVEELEEQGARDSKQKDAPYKLSIWENFLIIVVAILIVKLLANWLFGPA